MASTKSKSSSGNTAAEGFNLEAMGGRPVERMGAFTPTLLSPSPTEGIIQIDQGQVADYREKRIPEPLHQPEATSAFPLG